MAEKKKPEKKPTPLSSKPAAKPGGKQKPAPKSSALAKAIPPAFAQKLAPSFTRMPSDDRAPSGKGGKGKEDEGGTKNLTRQQVDAIRLLAITMAGPELADDAVMICNPVGEPAALPQSELLYDTCRWCNVDIYYDRLMPTRPDLMRVCLKCGILLLEADKKGAN
jgi:hypothetical protein